VKIGGVVLVLATLGGLYVLDNVAGGGRSLVGQVFTSIQQPGRLGPKPHLEFGPTPEGEVTVGVAGDNLVASVPAGETVVDKPTSVKLPLSNTGKARLELTLYFLSCDCVNGVKFNGGWVPVKHHLPTILDPGETGELEVLWKATPEQVADAPLPRDGRFSVEFRMNDPRAPKLRVEINSRIRWSETKSETDQAR
jgi:hypothetical protein